MATITGTAFADVITPAVNSALGPLPSAADDRISGLAGNDDLAGGGGADTILGGAGDDTLEGGAGADALYPDELIPGATAGDVVSYLGDTAGVSIILDTTSTGSFGDAQGDTLHGFANFLGGSGGDTVRGAGAGADNTIDGGDGADSLDGGTGDDLLVGGDGADTLMPGGGSDTLEGDDGTDTARFAGNAADHEFTLVGGDYGVRDIHGNETGLIGMESFAFDDTVLTAADLVASGTATEGDDSITGSDYAADVIGGLGGNDTLLGRGGADLLFGGDGNDLIDGGRGNDQMDGGAGADTLSLAGETVALSISLASGIVSIGGAAAKAFANFEVLIGGTGNDVMGGTGANNRLLGGAGADSLVGAAGDDTLTGGVGGDLLFGSGFSPGDEVGSDYASYAADGTGVAVDLAAGLGSGGEAQGDSIFGIANLEGGSGGDSLAGDTLTNVLIGLDGADTLEGRGGNDSLLGGNDDDVAAYAGDRADYQVVTLAGGVVVLDLRGGSPDGADTMQGVEFLAFADTLLSVSQLFGPTEGDDSLTGTPGADSIDGLGGNDTIAGLAGDDTLVGGTGADSIASGGGRDNVTGGDGADTLVGEGADTIGGATLDGGIGNDVLRATNTSFNLLIERFIGGDGDDLVIGALGGGDSLNGGAGADTVSYADATGGASIFLGDLGFAIPAAPGASWDSLFGFEAAIGSAFNDNLDATDVLDVRLEGRDGNDTIDGAAGADTLLGGTGDDRMQGREGDDVLQGGAGNDSLSAGDGTDRVLFSGSRADYLITFISGGWRFTDLRGGSPDGVDTVLGAEEFAFADTLLGAADLPGPSTVPSNEADSLIGTELNDIIDALGGDDTVVALAGQDSLIGGAGDDSLDGGGGGDTLVGGAGADTFNGDVAFLTDLVTYANDTVGVHVDLGAGTADFGEAAGDVITGPRNVNLLGGSGADTLAGRDASMPGIASNLTGGDGDDLLIGRDRFDFLTGGAGDDTLVGDANNDVAVGGAGADSMVGGDGFDQLLYGSAGGAIVLDLLSGLGSAGDALGDTVSGFERATGTAGADTLLGAGADESLLGDSGDDLLRGRGGDDFLRADDGADTLAGGAGNDSLLAGGGTDLVEFSGNRADYVVTAITGGWRIADGRGGAPDGADTVLGAEFFAFADGTLAEAELAGGQTVNGNDDDNTLDGGDGDDSLSGGGGDDSLDGNGGNDTLRGDDGADTLDGDDGDDSLSGDDGNDLLDGGNDNDTLIGGNGDDTLDGASGDDSLVGLAGADSLVGGIGADTLLGGGEDDVLHGDAGDDLMQGGDGGDVLEGGAGADTLEGGTGFNLVSYENDTAGVVVDLVAQAASGGEAEGDVISGFLAAHGGRGSDTLTGTADANWLFGGNGGNDRLDAGAGNDTLTAATFIVLVGDLGAAILLGGEGDDSIIGGIGAHTLDGGAGNDAFLSAGVGNRVLGGEGDDSLFVNGGAATAEGGAGDDLMGGEGEALLLFGGAGDDALFAVEGAATLIGGDGADSFSGAQDGALMLGDAGADVAQFAGPLADFLFQPLAGGFIVTRPAAGGAGDTLYGIETLVFADTVIGQEVVFAGDNSLTGGDGNDSFRGFGGDDVLDGGDGADSLAGNEGGDTLIGGDGADTLNGGFGNDSLLGQAGNDVLVGHLGADTVAGGAGHDIYGVIDTANLVVELAGGGRDVVVAEVAFTLPDFVEGLELRGLAAIDGTGNAMNNAILGNGAANRLRGLDGQDRLDGRDGADTLDGGGGFDRLSGGAGADLFLFGGPGDGGDRVLDFVSGEDGVALRASGFGLAAVGPLTGLTTPGGAARFVSSVNGASTAEAGEWQVTLAADGRLVLDLDGAGNSGRVLIGFFLNGGVPGAEDIRLI